MATEYEWRHAMADLERAAEAGEFRPYFPPPDKPKAPRRNHRILDYSMRCADCGVTALQAYAEDSQCPVVLTHGD
jgi:hypothetical protein